MQLDTIEKHKNYEIRSISADSADQTLLNSCGFVPGSQVKLLYKMPFNGPLAFQIRGSKYALRKEDAKRIQVVPLSVN